MECTMKLKDGIGSLNCRLCAVSYQMPIHHLHEPIDVFSEWLDACEAAECAKQADTDFSGGTDHRYSGGGKGGIHDDDDSDEDDEDILGEDSGFTKKTKTPASNHSTKDDRATKGSKPSEKRSRPSYAALGLDDSDDDE